MRRGLSHPEPTTQQRAHSLTHHSWLHLLNQWHFWQPPKLFLLFLRTVPNSLDPSCCSSLNRGAALFSQSTAQVGSRGTGISYCSCQLTWSSPQQGHTQQGELLPSAQMELAAAPTALHSRDNGQVWKCYVWDKKKCIFIFCLSAIIKKQEKKPTTKPFYNVLQTLNQP